MKIWAFENVSAWTSPVSGKLAWNGGEKSSFQVRKKGKKSFQKSSLKVIY